MRGENKINLGVITNGDNPNADLKRIKDLGFSCCQLYIKDFSSKSAKELRNASKKYGVQVTAVVCTGPGPYKWNFKEGPETVGLIPLKYRQERILRLHEGIDFCREAGVPAVHAHFGFIPENMNDPLYVEFIDIMKEIGIYAKERNIEIHFETGQETPITLVRAITDIGTGNIFVNCDLANLVMYGKSNPLDGLKIMRSFIKELHAKDGLYPDPANPYILGQEKPIPEGEVNFPAVIRFLKETDFKGALIIEHELDKINYDYILKTKKYLEDLINN